VIVTLGLLAACRPEPSPAPESEAPTAEVPAAGAAAPANDETLAKGIAAAPADADPAAAPIERPRDEPPAVDPSVEAPAEVPAADPPPADPAPAEPRRVLILGDSLAATGFGAMLEKKLDARKDVECFRKGKSASGLARPDFFDWPTEAKKQIEFRKPELVIVIMGGNDGQDMTRIKGKRVAWSDPDAWQADYRARMDAFLGELTADGRKVLWLGLPTMGLRSLETKLEMIRAIQKDAVLALGDAATYLDTAPFVTADDGSLLAEATVGKSKKAQPLRAEDKIHFTMSGSEYLADKVLPEVITRLGLPATEPSTEP
jgi:hypothetical protein